MLRFREACDATLALRSHKSRPIRLAVIGLLPRLAEFCPDAFGRHHLGPAAAHLMLTVAKVS